MNKKITHVVFFLMTGLFISTIAHARDTDVFLKNVTTDEFPPNVLVVMDNSANWNAQIGPYKKFEFLTWGLNSAFTHPSFIDPEHPDYVGRMNVGFMGFSNDNTPKGGKIHKAVRLLDADYQNELRDYFFYNASFPEDKGVTKEIAEVVNENCAAISTCLGYEAIETTNNAPYAMALNEAWLYFGGKAPHSGTEDYLGKFGATGGSVPNTFIDDYFDTDCTGIPGRPSSDASGNYISPIATNPCGDNYIIVIGNGTPDNGEDGPAEVELRKLGGVLDSDPINLDPDDNQQSNWADEYARYMAANDAYVVGDSNGDGIDDNGIQKVTTFVIDVFDVFSSCTAVDANGQTVTLTDSDKDGDLTDEPAYLNVVDFVNCTGNPTFRSARNWMRSIAVNGNGSYFQVGSADQLLAALRSIFQKIHAQSSVFASTTLPVSVNVRGTSLNQVYMGVFQPNENNEPRWYGNLKHYKLGYDNLRGVHLQDSNGAPAEDTIHGFIVEDAVSFWTTDSTFWNYRADVTESDSPDGRIVEKGGAAQKLRESYVSDTVGTGRKVLTCSAIGKCGAGFVEFVDTLDITTELNAVDDPERMKIINWVRGDDIEDETNDGDRTDVRGSIHGDVLHSRPAVINYNSDGSDNDIVVYYGANDGMLHAIDAGDSDSDGNELWSFVAPEHFSTLRLLYDNTPGSAGSTAHKPLFFDGPISTYRYDANGDGRLIAGDGDKVIIVAAMRRGGKFLYALDVTNRDKPYYLWSISNKSAGFEELGETWSDPSIFSMNLDLDGSDPLSAAASGRPVVMFGAGYDPEVDDVRASAYDTAARIGDYDEGRGIFVVDLLTGDLIWRAGNSSSSNLPSGSYEKVVAGMDYSIPSDLAAINADNDSYRYVDRVYVGDTGGNVWRADLSDVNPANWTVTKLADVGGSGSNARKFLYAPSVVQFEDKRAVLLGSGDREDPTDGLHSNQVEPVVANRYYMFLDDNSGTTLTEVDLNNVTSLLTAADVDQAISDGVIDLTNYKGWYITLDEGEKVVSSSVTIAGSTIFGTNTPLPIQYDADGNPLQCTTTLGEARLYVVDYRFGNSVESFNSVSGERYSVIQGGGFLPTPVPATVDLPVEVDTDGDGQPDATINERIPTVCIGAVCIDFGPLILDAREKKYWFKQYE